MALTGLFRVSCPSLDPNRDGFSNHFVFQSPSATVWTGIGPVLSAIQGFYNTVATGAANKVANFMGPSLDAGTNHATITVYDITSHLNGVGIGAPVSITNWTLAVGPGATSVPEGVAMCINYRADYGSDVEFAGTTSAIPTPPDIVSDYGAATTHTGRARPRSRDRNRLYLGPLNTACISNATTTNAAQFTTQAMGDCLKALSALSNTITAGTDPWNLRVWSRASASLKIPTEAWTDPRPDYQRRRSDPNPAARVFQALAAT